MHVQEHNAITGGPGKVPTFAATSDPGKAGKNQPFEFQEKSNRRNTCDESS